MKPFIKLFDKVILLLLGFSGILYSCAKYGMLVSMYEINGMVTDKTNGKSISNIRVIRQIYKDRGDTLYTNSEGKYAFILEESENPVRLKIEDIDGEENGGDFATKEIDVKLTDAERKNIEKYSKKGKKYLKIQNIELERKYNTVDPLYGVKQATFKE